MSTQPFTVAEVRDAADIAAVTALFHAYAASLPVDLGYQGFASEVATLPGAYSPPDGALLLARHEDGRALGCVAVRPQRQGVAELKRLYVGPDARGLGLGRALLLAALDAARRAGHQELRLDTLPTMHAAIALYRAEGFEPVAAYYDGAPAGTLFFSRRLDAGAE